MNYRRLGLKDIEQTAALIALLVEELGDIYRMEDIIESLDILIPQKQMFVACGAFDGDTLVGGIGMIKQGQLYNRADVIAHEAFWYVQPSYRGRVGIKLLELVEKECGTCKIDFGINSPALIRFVSWRGYKPIKTIVRKGGGHV